MNEPTWLFIQGCWIVWLIYWIAMSFSNKRTVERQGFVGYRLISIVIVVGFFAAERATHVATHSQLWHTPLALGIAASLIVLAGAAFTVWARVVLGRNWSAEVTFKEDHELIESGPYSLARHPIYTGLITMALGTAVAYGRALGFVLFLALCGGLWWKARQEEQIMSRHFPEAYAEYRTRVHAIVPGVL